MVRRTRQVLILTATAALALSPVLAVTSGAATAGGSHVLPGGGHGHAAVAALGSHLDTVAKLNGLSTARFTNVLDTDTTAHLDRDGRLYYVEPAPSVTASAAAAVSARPRVTAKPALNVSIVPALHSRAASTHKIFLDFNGATIPSTSAWTTATKNKLTPGAVGGFDLDGNPSTYSTAEVAYIEKVWRIVSEKYSPFDVDVTTVDPGAAGYTRTSPGSGDVSYGDHVVITSDTRPVTQICGGSCAGIAYNGTFDLVGNAAYDPVWVFASQAFGSAQLTAHDAAHEVGHTFGLTHDGLTTVSGDNYYAGQGNWVPIMGLTNQNAVAQFSKGEYTDANNTQDDLALIGLNGNSGAANSLLLPDDYPNTGSAPDALGDQSSYALDGVISNATDDDLFSIAPTCTATLTATATGIGAGQSLDLKVEILDGSNSMLASNDPTSGESKTTQADGDVGYLPTGMDASASLASATAGATYRIRVSGVGSGNPLTTGYSNYGSIGQYHLAITACGTTAPTSKPSLAVTLSGTTATLHWTPPANHGGAVLNNWTVRRSGPGTQPANKVVPVSPDNSTTMSGLAVGRQTFTVTGNYSATTGAGIASDPKSVTVIVKPSAPRIGSASSGAKHGAKTATARWLAPTTTGGAVITGYRVVAYKIVKGRVARTFTSKFLSASTRKYNYRLGAGRFKFRVVAYNKIGGSPSSAYSKVVTSR
jgi:hypothetical protein